MSKMTGINPPAATIREFNKPQFHEDAKMNFAVLFFLTEGLVAAANIQNVTENMFPPFPTEKKKLD